MKKLILYKPILKKEYLLPIGLFVIFQILFLSVGWSQTGSTSTVNLILTEVISIAPESIANGGVIDFQYHTVEDYQSDQIISVPNSLIITFTNPFELKVQANGAFFENGDQQIPVNVLTIQRNESSAIQGESQSINLSPQPQVLISGIGAGSLLNIDLDYIIPAEISSSTDILGKPSGTYTQEITYTVVAL